MFGRRKNFGKKNNGNNGGENTENINDADSVKGDENPQIRDNLGDGFPWKNDSANFSACNFALGHLKQNLMAKVAIDQRIHAETLVSAIGCIAGFASQVAVFQHLKNKKDTAGPSEIMIVPSKDGKEHFFGEPLNQMLLTDYTGEMKGLSFWGLVAGGVLSCTNDKTSIPSWESMFTHVAEIIMAGKTHLDVGQYSQPQLPPVELLKIVWPLAESCFTGQIGTTAQQTTASGKSSTKYGIAPPKYWPVISGYIANTYIREAKDTLDPSVAATICMESAIYCSKITNLNA